MSTVLNDPLGILRQQRKVQAGTVGTTVTARLENNRVGICPVCEKPMASVEAAGIDSFVCYDDHVCLPKPNAE